jgi:uncharacterized membrane protein
VDTFWMWFTRPFAEFLGTVALIGVVVLLASSVVVGWVGVEMLRDRWRRKK